MTDTQTAFELAHVLFMDVVGYSKLLIDDQRELIAELNTLVLATEPVRMAEAAGKLIRLPTGDGMALAFFTTPEAPVRCAVEIDRALSNRAHLNLRMGIHTGPVSTMADVNERSNVAGAGINMAQRVMDCGDAGHILLSARVAEDLAHFHEWSTRLHDLGECEVKHGVRLRVFNLFGDGFGNPAVPAAIARQGQTGLAQVTTEQRSRRTKLAIAIGIGATSAVIATALLLSRRWLAHVAPVDKSIAVLPFVDLSAAKDQEYFCDGISEEILDTLAKTEGLRVVARTSSFSFKGKSADVSEIGQKLGVATILEGSMRRDGNRIRVTAQLINARDGFHLWSETFDREFQGVFAMQDEITRAITDALRLKLVGSKASPKRHDTAAYDLYLQGVFFSNKSTEEGLRKSLEFFQRSLEKEQTARAWAGIAKAWTWLADAYVKPVDAYPKAREAAMKAVELDEREPEGHVYLSEIKRVLDWDMAGCIAELERALQLDPNGSTPHLYLGLNAEVQGRPDAALAHVRASLKADPLSPLISNFAAFGYLCLGRLDDAAEEGKRTLQLDPNYIYESPVLAAVFLELGRLDEAIALYKKGEEKTGVPQPGLAIAFARNGCEAEARQILDALLQRVSAAYFPGEEIAAVYAALGQNDEAFKWLDRACDEHSGPIHAIAVRPVFRPLYPDPRFAAVLRRIGLDPAVLPHLEAKQKPRDGSALRRRYCTAKYSADAESNAVAAEQWAISSSQGPSLGPFTDGN